MKKESIKIFDPVAEQFSEVFGIPDTKELDRRIDRIYGFVKDSFESKHNKSDDSFCLDKLKSIQQVVEEVGEVSVSEAFFYGYVYGTLQEKGELALGKSLELAEELFSNAATETSPSEQTKILQIVLEKLREKGGKS